MRVLIIFFVSCMSIFGAEAPYKVQINQNKVDEYKDKIVNLLQENKFALQNDLMANLKNYESTIKFENIINVAPNFELSKVISSNENQSDTYIIYFSSNIQEIIETPIIIIRANSFIYNKNSLPILGICFRTPIKTEKRSHIRSKQILSTKWSYNIKFLEDFLNDNYNANKFQKTNYKVSIVAMIYSEYLIFLIELLIKNNIQIDNLIVKKDIAIERGEKTHHLYLSNDSKSFNLNNARLEIIVNNKGILSTNFELAAKY
jgi:hypothetical protein